LRQSLVTEIEPEVQAKYETKQQEKLAAEAEAEAKKAQETPNEEPPAESPGTLNSVISFITGAEQDSSQEPPIESPPELTEDEILKKIEEEKESIRQEIINAKIQENHIITSIKSDIQSVDTQIHDVNKEISELDKEIKELENYLNFDFGPESRYSYLYDQSHTFNSAEYVYTLKPFKDVTQGHVRVGNWAHFESNYRELKFDHGERCWGGPDRSILVTLHCGADTQILDVKEPNKCEYVMTMKTPGACTNDDLQVLKDKLLR